MTDELHGAGCGFIPTLTLEQAQRLVAAALSYARSEQFQAMALVVLDGAGHVLSSAREHTASPLRLEIAAGKAAAAIGMGASTRVLSERAKALPTFFGAVAAAASAPFIPHVGAVLIRDDQGAVLGAVGASGASGDEDELLCIVGVRAIGLSHA